MKTLKVEEVYLMEYETFDDVAASLRASGSGANVVGKWVWRNPGNMKLSFQAARSIG